MTPGRRALLLGWALQLAACGGPAGEPAAPAPSPAAVDPRDTTSPSAMPFTTELLRKDAAARRDASDGRGRAWFAGEKERTPRARSAERGRWTLVYEAAPPGIAPGGSVRIQFPMAVGWSLPQLASPSGLGFVKAVSEPAGIPLALRIERPPWLLAVDLAERGLAPGERLLVTYGAGTALASADWSAEWPQRFWVLVDGDGDGAASPIDGPPGIDVDAGPAARLEAVWPTTARPGEPVRLRISALDAHGNLTQPGVAAFALGPLPTGVSGPSQLVVDAGRAEPASALLTAQRDGVYRLTVRAGKGLVAITNPLVVSTGPRLLWGDLHGHTQLSDGTGTPAEYFRYARDVAGVDVSALTDHDHWGAPRFLDEQTEAWDAIRKAVESLHEPERFVTLLGYEWTSWIHGHRHVLHFDDDGPLLSSLDPRYADPAKLWEALRGRRALTFAHHTAGSTMAINWAFAPDPELEPAVEIVSIHGSSESSDTPRPVGEPRPGAWVRDALARGYRLGFVGSGDSHDGHPGCARDPQQGSCGLAGIWSESLTREGVFEALRARRTYATNGPRILLEARMDGHAMGASLPAAGRHRLTGRIVAVKPLEKLEVIRSGVSAASIPCERRRELDFELDLDDLRPGDSVYVRAVQIDTGAAWSSPFFFD